MKFKEVIGRITGFSVPIFGVSWNPPQPDVTAARKVLVFLEDRRVLYIRTTLRPRTSASTPSPRFGSF